MGLDQHREVHLLGQAHPALEQRQAVPEPPRPDVGLDVEVMERELGRDLEHGLEVVDRLREALPFGGHPGRRSSPASRATVARSVQCVLTPSKPAPAIIATFSSSERSNPSVCRRSIAQSDCSTASRWVSVADIGASA